MKTTVGIIAAIIMMAWIVIIMEPPFDTRNENLTALLVSTAMMIISVAGFVFLDSKPSKD